MYGCEKFRFMAEADPGRLAWRQRLHMFTCRACEGYLALMRRLDDRIKIALELEYPATPLRSTRYRSKVPQKESGSEQESAD